MNEILKNLYNACDPIAPASSRYYVDCSDVRGSNALAKQFQRELAKTDKFLHFLFSGHIGSGKSSELEHLRNLLLQPSTPHKRYFPVLMDAGEYLDEYDVTSTDILLSIVSEVGASLKEELGIELSDSYFVRRFKEVGEVLQRDVSAEGVDLTMGMAKSTIKLLKKDPTARKKVREKLLPQTTTILTEINTVFDDARIKLKKRAYPEGEKPFTDIVLILDNLEKIQRIDHHKEGEESQRELFIERAPQFNGLEAHVVFTLPLSLVRSHGPQLERLYGNTPLVLPMIKVMERDRTTGYPAGRARLSEILQKRADGKPIAEIFRPNALDWLITYCGGDVRELVHFVRRACNETETLPIDLKAAQRALRPTISTYSTSIPAAHWPKLAKLERSPDQTIDNNDPDSRKMLEMVSVMEYLNGGDESDPFSVAEPWYAVNPIVRQLSQFKAALAALDAGTSP